MGQRDASAELVVRVPADARLFVDDQAMRTTGTVRCYRSPELAASATYEYELRAEITRDGQTTTQTKLVRVTAGTSQELDFELDSPQTTLVSHP